jgi:hypothetical protein
MHLVSLLVIVGVFALVGAQYSNPVQVGPSTNPATVTAASIQKVSDLASEMYSRWEALDQACDPRAPFAVAYLFMTANARRLITNNYFDDGNKMADFIQTFATRYITAYDNWASNNTAGVSQPWQIAFSFAAGGHSDVTQDLTLGMNAHINYDLAIATFESGYAVPQWAPDYYRVNDLMNQIDANVTHALGRYDPQFYNTDFLSQAYFTGSVQFVTSWRTGAYTTAVAYQAASLLTDPLGLGNTSLAALEATSETTAVAAAVPWAIPYLNSTAAARRAYCMTQNQQPIGI